ncbi:MAG: hypothetical protein ACJ74H_17810 [Thermoanaerobaculia bacterium]
MNAPTDWTSALAILAAGLILGTLVFFASRRRKASAANNRQQLEARRDALVQQLRDLGEDVADDERTWLESETAEVLRALDKLPVDAPSRPRPRSATFGFVWGVVCTLIAVGIVYYGSTFTHDDQTVEQRIEFAKAAFSRNDLNAVFVETKAVLEQDPSEPRALTYNAVARMARGEIDQARTQLEQATQRDPKLLDAWVALASVRTQAGEKELANAAIEAAIAQHPDEEKHLRGVFAEMQKTSSKDLPPDHPPMPTSAPAASSNPIRVTLSLDPSATVKSGVVYVIARGAEAGHPVAVRRIDAAAFPIDVELGAGDAMMGQALPPHVRVEARLDSDGDAGTKDPNDLNAFADGVAAGASVTLTLAKTN